MKDELNYKISELTEILDEIVKKVDERKEDISNETNLFKEMAILKTSIIDDIEILESVFNDSSKYIVQLKDFILDFIEQHIQKFQRINKTHYSEDETLISAINNLEEKLSSDLNRGRYLSLIGNKNITIVGGNGVGKSAFASYLKESISNQIKVISAQKILYYNPKINGLYRTSIEDINKKQNENYIEKGRINNGNGHASGQFINELSEIFSQLITTICNIQVGQYKKIANKEAELDVNDTILIKINTIYKELVPNITFDIDHIDRVMYPQKNSVSYDINAMSDGEKVILYYICQILLAEENSFIIIDEPETFLNPANYNRLWDHLESQRPDCKFIYISHTVDFIASRKDADLLWCKGMISSTEWDIEKIGENSFSTNFPKELIAELLGARKPILFCEGEDKSKLDYQIYSKLFESEVTVYPVGNKENVKKYTTAYNNLPLFNNNTAYGIVDNDLISEEEENNLFNKKIFVLPFNEIEMLLFVDEIMQSVSDNTYEETENKISDFKSNFFEKLKEDKQEIIYDFNKSYFDYYLSTYNSENRGSMDKLINEAHNWLNNEDFKAKSEMFEDSFTEALEILNDKNYLKLLELCPLKKDITKGLANQIFQLRYYEDVAITQLKKNSDLCKRVRNNYLSNIYFT